MSGKIRSGGYAIGCDYRYYREHGWGRFGSWYMARTFWEVMGGAVLIGLVIGWLIGAILF